MACAWHLSLHIDRVGVLTNDLEGVKTERDGLKREKEQWLAAKNSLTLSMEHSKTELASSMQRISGYPTLPYPTLQLPYYYPTRYYSTIVLSQPNPNPP